MFRRRKTPSDLPQPRARLPILAAVAVAGLALAGCQTSADGYNDGSSNDEAPDVALVRSLMEGLGAVDAKSQPKIDYKPRAPLAMPTTMDTLPPPEEPKVVANWPTQNDAELKKIQDLYRNTTTGKDGDLVGSNRLTPEQSRGIQQLATGGQSRDIAKEIQLEERLENARLKPSELNQRVGRTEQNTALFDDNGTPVRRYLIEPPTAYSTPSDKAPVIAPSKVRQAPAANTVDQLMDGRSARTIQ